MEIKIGKKIRSSFRDIYEIESTWMWNDADGWNYDRTYYKIENVKENKSFQSTIKFLKYANKYKNGCASDLEKWKYNCAEYLINELPELLELEEGDNEGDYLDWAQETIYDLGWINDGCSGIPYSPHGYKVYWYDKNGDKHDVKVMKIK